MSAFLTAVPETAGAFLLAFIGSPRGLFLCWLIVINLVAFLVFGVDKLKAKYKEKHEAARRVPEKTLFVLAAVGGSVGALLGMKVFHHKTLHKSFRIGIPLILAAQIVLAAGLYLYWTTFRGA